MKKILLFAFVLLFNLSYAQDVVILGFTSNPTDQFSFVATADIPIGTTIHFADGEYSCTSNNILTEGTVSFTSTMVISEGEIVVIESGASNSHTVVTGQGTATESDAGFDLSASGDGLYAFLASNNSSPNNSITSISSFVDTNSGTSGDAPTCDYPSAIVIDFTTHQDNFDYTGPRNGTTISDLSDITNYTQSSSEITLNANPFTNAQLPIAIVVFTAKPHSNQTVMLDWITSSEENNEYFSIEHSTDGRNFESVETIEGALNSVEMQYYSYKHENTVKGDNYYRLRQVDTDGTFSFSAIEVVRIAGDISVEVRPTLAESSMTVFVGDAFDNDVEVEVINILGRTVIVQNLSRGDIQLELSVADLQKGHYFVRIRNGAEARVTRFIKR